MTTLGIDFSTPLSSEQFQSQLEQAQDNRVLATWNICDLNYYAKRNPEYDDIYQQYRDDTKIADSTINKYNSTIETFPLHRRNYHLSIDMYSSVVGLRDEDGKPMEETQNELLRQVVKRKGTGATGLRKWLRNEVKRIKREAVTEKEIVTLEVGDIDDQLRTVHNLPDGYEVQITIVRTLAYEQSDLEESVIAFKQSEKGLAT